MRSHRLQVWRLQFRRFQVWRLQVWRLQASGPLQGTRYVQAPHPITPKLILVTDPIPGGHRPMPGLTGEDFIFEDADVREVAVGAGEVQAVADDELVGDLEAQVLDVELDLAAGGLGEEGADL